MAAGTSCRTCCRDQVSSPCCLGGLPRRSRRLRRRIDGVDLISALPDDLLLQILARLGCARAAAHTSLLVRRWRGLWTRLPELTFHNICPDPLDAALAQVSGPAVSLLDISLGYNHPPAPARIASLLRAAQRLLPAELHVCLWGKTPRSGNATHVVELPCFNRATLIWLNIRQVVRFTLPKGNFTALEVLLLTSCQIDLADLLRRCSRLRRLEIYSWPHNSIVVHSPSVEELHVHTYQRCQRLDIVAPSLKKLHFDADSGISDEFALSYSAPAVEELSWNCECPSSIVGFGQFWWLGNLDLATSKPLGPKEHTIDGENTCLQLQQQPHDILGGAVQNIEKQLFQSLTAKVVTMELEIVERGHAYGAMVLHLLGFCTSIQKLMVKLYEGDNRCSVNCPCDQSNSWRSQSVSLTNLKEVEFQGFKGEDHEIELLKVVFRSATMLETLIVKWSNKISPSGNGCMEIRNILKAYPSVKCKHVWGAVFLFVLD
ncbi:hypothetical protein EJB05_12579, partial [Eragrostis curvula]